MSRDHGHEVVADQELRLPGDAISTQHDSSGRSARAAPGPFDCSHSPGPFSPVIEDARSQTTSLFVRESSRFYVGRCLRDLVERP